MSEKTEGKGFNNKPFKKLLDKNGNYDIFIKDLEKEIHMLANSNRYIIKVYEDVLCGKLDELEGVDDDESIDSSRSPKLTTMEKAKLKDGKSNSIFDEELVADNSIDDEENEFYDDTVLDTAEDYSEYVVAVMPPELKLYNLNAEKQLKAYMDKNKVDMKAAGKYYTKLETKYQIDCAKKADFDNRRKLKQEQEFKEKEAYESNKLVITSAIKRLLSEKFTQELMAAPDAMDKYKSGLKIKTGWINRPEKLLKKIKAVLEGNDIYQRKPNEEARTLLKATVRAKFDQAKQHGKQDILQYIIHFNKIVNDLEQAYGPMFDTFYTQQDLVMRFISSLEDKTIYRHYETGANLGTTKWPRSLEEAKELVVAQLKVKPIYGSSTNEVALLTNDRQGDKDKTKHCYICKKTGHWKNECPQFDPNYVKKDKKKKPEGKKDAALLTKNDEAEEQAEDELELMCMTAEVSNKELSCNVSPWQGIRILIDCASTQNIYKDIKLIKDLATVKSAIECDTMAGTFRLEQRGICAITGDIAYYNENAPANLWSLARMEDKFETTYTKGTNGERSRFKVPIGTNNFVFYRTGKLYECVIEERECVNTTIEEEKNICYPDNIIVESNKIVEAAEKTKAKKIARVMRNVNISEGQLADVIQNKAWDGIDGYELQDLKDALDIYGTDPAYIKGRGRLLHNAKTSVPNNPTICGIVLFFDIMFVLQQPYLIAVTDRAHGSLVLTKHLESRYTSDHILENLQKFDNMLKTRRWNVIQVWSDSETGITKDKLATIGLAGDQFPAGTKVGEVEVQVRLVKERIRSMLSTLLYVFPLLWVKYLIIAATIQLNCTYKESIKKSSREYFLGRKPMLSDLEKTSFGALVEVVDAEKTNDVKARSRTGIALYPTLDNAGSWVCMILETKHTVISRSFKNIKPDEDSIALINAYAKQGIAGTGAIAEQILLAFDGELQDLNMAEEQIYQLHELARCYHISYKQAKKQFGEEMSYKSAYDEIFDIITKGCWNPINYGEKTADATSFMFLKDKRDKISNALLKLKCRHVYSKIHGDENIDASTIETRAPTPSWNVASLLFAEIAEKNLVSKVMDVPGAFTWADNPNGHVMLLDEITTKIATDIKPEWKQYIYKNNKMKVELIKNQYGTEEAAKLWYDYLKNILEENGFMINKIEPCLFTKVSNTAEDKSKKTVILVYVDDLLVIDESTEGLDSVEAMLKAKFGEKVAVSEEGEYDYLGVRISHDRNNKTVKVNSHQYVENMLKSLESDIPDITQSDSPSGKDLFELNAESPQLSTGKAKLYHSVVAKLLWIAMRVRIDALMPIVYLASKVHCSTEHEFAKLLKVIGYLKKYPRMSLKIKGDELFTNGVLNIWVDASHAVHKPSMRSHIGVFMSAGKGPIMLKSIGAKRQTNSSTASEIYALSSAVSLICGAVNFLRSYGVKIKDIIVHEDNEAVLKLVKGTKPMNDLSKHMEIQRLFIKDNIEQEDMMLVYCKSEEMIADVLTKAMSGALFKRLVLKMGLENEE